MNTEKRYRVLFAAALILRLVYTFVLTNWPHYLWSDMGGYWSRALQRLGGEPHAYLQYMLWPPMAHVLLSEVFAACQSCHLALSSWLAVALLIQAILGALSCLWLVQLIRGLSGSSCLGWLTGWAWALWMPCLYWGSFLLSEDIALPLMIGAARLLLVASRVKWPELWGGMILALIVAIRPSTSLALLVIVAYMVPSLRASRPTLVLLACGYVLVLSMCMGEVSAISGGRMSAKLSNNGGMNFALEQGQFECLASKWPGGMFVVTLPQYVGRGGVRAESHHEWRDETFYYLLGLREMLKPGHFLHDLAQTRLNFLGTSFPEVRSAAGWRRYEAVGVPIIGVLSMLVLAAFPVLSLVSGSRRWEWLLWGLSMAPVVTGVLYSCDRRYGLMTSWAVIGLSLQVWRRCQPFINWSTFQRLERLAASFPERRQRKGLGGAAEGSRARSDGVYP